MQIIRDLFPTDAARPYLTLTLESRDHDGHSLLSALGEADRAMIGDVMANAVIAISGILRRAAGEGPTQTETSSFGCGT
jgi:hypothetical protein